MKRVSALKILSFGEVLWDVYPKEKFIGGAPFNFSAHIARLGVEAFLLSAVGDDVLGKEPLREVERLGVRSDFVSVLSEKPTGSCLVTLDENSVPSYNLLDDVAYDRINCDKITDDFDVLYFGTLALRGEYNRKSLQNLISKRSFKEVFVDVNIRPPFYCDDTVRLCAQNATIIKISDEELPAVAGSLNIAYDDYKAFAKSLSAKYGNLKCIIITLGEKGAYAFDCENNGEYSVPAKRVEVVSTVGAGDSFSASFLHRFLEGEGIPDCLEHATEIAALVVASHAAISQ